MHGRYGRANPVQGQRCQDVHEQQPVHLIITFSEMCHQRRGHSGKESRREEQRPKPASQLFPNERWLFTHHLRGIIVIIWGAYSQTNETKLSWDSRTESRDIPPGPERGIYAAQRNPTNHWSKKLMHSLQGYRRAD